MITKICLFTLFALFLTAIVSIANKRLVLDLIYDPQIFKLDSTTHVLLIGASDIEFSLNPKLIKNSYNVARPAENFFYNYYKLKFILESNPQINTIIIGFGYPSLSQASAQDINGANASQFYDRYFMLLDAEGRTFASGFNKDYLINLAKFHYGVPLEFYKHIELFGRILFNNHNINLYPFWGGFQKDLEFFKKNAEKILGSPIRRHYYINNILAEKSDVLINYLEKIVLLCKERNIRLVLLKTPLKKAYRNEIPPYHLKLNSKVLERVKSLNSGIESYDYLSFFTDDAYFLDWDHLNKKGADIFTARLNRDIFLQSDSR